jgi:hypothetical protein
MEEKRIIEVDRDWYVKLSEYLQATERWSKVTDDGNGLALRTPIAGKLLIFRPKRVSKDS